MSRPRPNLIPSQEDSHDSDFARDAEDHKSTTGVGYFLSGSLVTWASQKQRIVTLSSCEAEYVAGAVQQQHARAFGLAD